MHARTLARLVLAATLALVALGGVVHTTGSSLACPDWPLCHGEIAPRMEGGVLYEHSHRLLALGVLAGMLALPFVARGRERRLALLGVVLVVAQALLGATTVLLRLPPIVSIGHLGTATAIVALLTVLSTRRTADPGSAGLGHAHLGPTIAIVVAQILLGAAVRHLGASAACGRDVLLCDGAIVPPHGLAWLHVAHRALGLIAVAAVAHAGWRIARDRRRAPAARDLGYALVLAAPAQLVLGLLTVALGPRLVPVTTHLVLAQLLLVALVHLGDRLDPATARDHGVPAGTRAISRIA